MKTNKEFIDKIYDKYDEYLLEKEISRKNINKKVCGLGIVAVLFSMLFVLTGCGNPEQMVIKEEGTTKESTINLQTVGNFENFYKIMKEKYAENQKQGYYLNNDMIEDLTNDIAEEDTSKSETSTRSETNTQVENVDEADVVKVDSRYIYYISEGKVIIIDAQNPDTSEKIAEINYKEENFNPRELYINNNKLIVVGNEYDNLYKTESTVVEDVVTYDVAKSTDFKSKSGIIIYDITNIKEPKESRRVMVEGTYISSRMIGNNIYFVSNKNIYSSNILRKQLQDLNQEDYKPRYIDTAVNEEEKCIDYSQIYCLKGTEDTSYLMLTGLNIDSNEEAEIRTFLGAGEFIYASEKNMYVATNKTIYGDGYEVLGRTTHILKFGLENGKFKFKAEVDINGQINNQFSMDENGEYFRIATTTGNLWNIDENTSNNLYILNDKLEEVGKVTEFAKEEKIYSVRYVGDKAYVVTFKQTDPLFVIDLSVPSNPQILGKLKIPGYSTYLHPYDETHIIGFGYDTKEDGTRITTNGLKMVMFDISDLNNPKELFKVSVGDRYTSSALIYNHKALLYSKEKNIIAFPLTNYSNGQINSRAVIYEIDLEKGFILKGEISHKNDDYTKNVERIVYINNTYYTLSKTLIKVANMETLEVIKEIEI